MVICWLYVGFIPHTIYTLNWRIAGKWVTKLAQVYTILSLGHSKVNCSK